MERKGQQGLWSPKKRIIAAIMNCTHQNACTFNAGPHTDTDKIELEYETGHGEKHKKVTENNQQQVDGQGSSAYMFENISAQNVHINNSNMFVVILFALVVLSILLAIAIAFVLNKTSE